MTPHEILGVSKNATEEEIKSAYRKLAKKYHPDINQGDTDSNEKFLEVQKAYEALTSKKNENSFNIHDNDFDFQNDFFDFAQMFRNRYNNANRKTHIRSSIAVPLDKVGQPNSVSLEIAGQTIAVEIPEGVVTGSMIHYPLNDNIDITLIVDVVSNDSRFVVDGNNLTYNYKISASDFNSLNTIEVTNHLGKKYMVNLKENMHTNSYLRIPNGGLYDSQRKVTHDLYIKFIVFRDAPTNSTSTTKKNKKKGK